jgi:hypothetical protein
MDMSMQVLSSKGMHSEAVSVNRVKAAKRLDRLSAGQTRGANKLSQAGDELDRELKMR